MAVNLKEQREGFVKMNFEEKRHTVVTILENIREGNSLFSDLYNLVVSDYAIEQDFYDIFDSLMIVLYREEKTIERQALERLEDVKTRLEDVKTKEVEEATHWQKEATELLEGMV